MNSAIKQLCTAFVAMVVVSACANLAGPDYTRSSVPWKDLWSEQSDVRLSVEKSLAIDWWREFNDPYLNELVERALRGNFNLKVLVARINAAGAVTGQAAARALPVVTAEVGSNVQRNTGEDTSEQYGASATLSWEIDIWGRVAKGVQAQQSEYRATESDWRAGYLTLAADVSTTYFEVRRFDEAIAQQTQAVKANGEILGIYRARHKEGLLPDTRLLQQEAEVSRLRNELLDLQRRRALVQNALTTLLGTPAGEFEVPVAPLRQTVQLVTIPAGLPFELLSRRPDVLAAEYRVLSAHHTTGEARLAKLPTLSLTGRAGTASFLAEELGRSWTFGLLPTLSFGLFDPNRSARVRVEEAQTQLANAQYRAVVIAAYEEVENALVNLSIRRRQRGELSKQLESLRLAAEQIRAQLYEGLVSQLELFEAERSLLSAEQGLLDNHQHMLAQTIQLYKALGGGWSRQSVEGTQS